MFTFKRSVAVFLSSLVVFPVLAQPQAQAPAASYENLFSYYGAFLNQVRQACKSGECNALANEGALLLRDGQEKHRKGWRVASERRQFHRSIAANLDQLHDALVRQRDIEERLSAKREKVRILPADYNCDQVFAEALAICSAWLVASPIAATICVGVAVYAYNQCLQQQAWQPPSQWD